MWAWIFATWLLTAEDAAAPPDSVTTLVEQLSADEVATRDQAQQTLVKLGPKILGELPGTGPSTSGELQKRLRYIRAALDQQLTEQLSQPTLVTFAGTHRLKEVLAELEKQSGNKLIDQRRELGQAETDPEITLSETPRPLWQVLDDVLDQAQLTTYDYGENHAITLTAQTESARVRTGHGVYQGPFRFEAARVLASRNLLQSEETLLQLSINMTWEPRVQPVSVKVLTSRWQGSGDGVEEILAQGSGEPELTVNDGASATELTLPFTLPSRSVVRLEGLKGSLKVLAIGNTEDFRFDKLPSAEELHKKPITIDRAGVRVRLQQIQSNEGVVEILVGVHYPKAKNALESYRSWIYQSEVHLIGPDGQRIAPGGFEQMSGGDSDFTMKYLFDLPNSPQGMTLVYRAPISVVEIPVDVEFPAIELP